METFLTAVGFVILVVVGSVLWVFVWDKIDNKRKKSGIDLGDDTSDEVAPLPLAGREVLDLAETSVTKVQVSVKSNKLPASLKATSEVTVALFNPQKNLVKGGTVNLAVDIGTIQTPAKDNSDGTYSAIYTAGNVAGEAKISAVTATGKFVTTIITLLDTKVKLTAQKTTLTASTSASTVLTIYIKDSEGNPVIGEALKLKAEKGTITSFFEKTYDSGWTDCIIAHRNGCIGCYIFTNYAEWIQDNHPDATHNILYPWKSQSEKEWIKFIIVIGQKELDTMKFSVRDRETKELHSLSIAEFIEKYEETMNGMISDSIPLSRFISQRPQFK